MEEIIQKIYVKWKNTEVGFKAKLWRDLTSGSVFKTVVIFLYRTCCHTFCIME